jgi:hypothetical protein
MTAALLTPAAAAFEPEEATLETPPPFVEDTKKDFEGLKPPSFFEAFAAAAAAAPPSLFAPSSFAADTLPTPPVPPGTISTCATAPGAV